MGKELEKMDIGITESLCRTPDTAMAAKSPQSCPTVCDPMDSSPPGSSVHRIL